MNNTSNINNVNKNIITKIIIENFQSHKHTVIIPAGAGQLTVIVGQSRQGKTAIFRALRWLFYNAPDGTDFIRWGANFARVTAEYADGTQVIRHRTSGSVNRYIIGNPGRQEQVYEGFGRGAVPLEVQQVTGVSPVEIGEGLTLNLNLAEQLDGPFLGNKSVSSTARAKVLGKLAGTEEVDLAGKQLGTDLFRWKRDKEAHEKEINGTQEQLQGYEYLAGFKAALDKLAGVRDVVKAAKERREQLAELHSEYTQVNFKANDERIRMLRYRDLVDDLVLAVEAIKGQIWSLSKMRQVKAEWDKISASILATESTIRETQGLSQAELVSGTTEGQFGRRQQEETIITQWDKTVWDLEQVEKVLHGTQGVHTAEKLANMAQKNITQLTSLIPINQQLGSTKTNLWKAVWTISETDGVPQAESSLAELYSSLDRKGKLAILCSKWHQSKEDMAVVDRQMERAAGIGKAEKLVSVINKDIVRIKWLDNFTWNLDTYKKQITTETILAQDAKTDIDKYQHKYYETLKQAGKCPVCGGEITKEKIGEVV